MGIPFTPSAQPSFHDRDPVDTPAPQPPPVAYYPQGRGIRVIQQYVTAISERYNPGDARERERNTWDYDLIGAVGLKESKPTKKSTVMYHVRWRGFPISKMTWEPEIHFSPSDLEPLWLTHGRVSTTGEISRFGGDNDSLHRHLPEGGNIFAQWESRRERERKGQKLESAENCIKVNCHEPYPSIQDQTAMESAATNAIPLHPDESDGSVFQKTYQRHGSDWQDIHATLSVVTYRPTVQYGTTGQKRPRPDRPKRGSCSRSKSNFLACQARRKKYDKQQLLGKFPWGMFLLMIYVSNLTYWFDRQGL